MQAVILAAGRGNRLKPLTDEVPKSLVEVCNTSFLENSLNALIIHKEIKKVIIVVGYKKELIIDGFGDQYKGVQIEYVDNPKWNSTNNIQSLWLATGQIDDDFILMEGDIYFESEILDFIFQNRDKNIAYLSKYHSSMSGTVVEIDEKGKKMMSGAIIEMDKRFNTIKRLIPGSEQDIHFEFSDKYKTVNIYYFTKEFFSVYFKPNLEMYIKTHGVKDYYELVLGTLIYQKTPNIYGHIVDRDTWFEVDTEDDLEMATYHFSRGEDRVDWLYGLYGGHWRYDCKDFCYLFNLYFPPQDFYTKLSHELPILINNYPSAHHKIASLLSQWYFDDGFSKDNLIVGNGASELIKIINKNLINKITIPVPSFNEYENLENEKINYLNLKEEDDFLLDEDEFIDSAIKSKSNFALIINPNNPTSTVTRKEQIIKILKELNHLDGIIIDESFIDFAGDREKYSVQPFINNYPNLIILRSLSKEFGIPGLRLGYLLTANQSIKRKVKKELPIWNINSMAERFLELFPRYQKHYNRSIEKIIEDRDQLISLLKDVPHLKIIDGKANYLFCKLLGEIKSRELKVQLYSKYNILIKDCSNKTALDDSFVRISIRKPDENIELVNALKEIL
ncbi:MAG: aminotransferase class I/II-fold pyridoxal phosphate-dependent enzyme [Candidatus Cloacimonetes bacterium]|nr:aminotransferase class I/II-fold pyridoxal phosphate-dependent enzyme [Candidatus Cloacimonadota bacterium]